MTVGATALALLLLVWGPRLAGRPDATLESVTPIRRRHWLPVAVCVSCGVVASASGIRARQVNADATYLRAQVSLDRGEIAEAQELFQQARMRAPLSNTAIHATYFEGVALYRAKQWSQARRAFRLLVDRFPEAQAAAESLYHVGLCAEHLGDTAEAMSTYEATERRFPGTPWAEYAAARRAALRGA
jgi:TolA-binding protein